MDLPRTALKTLFAANPIEDAAPMIIGGVKKKTFLTHFELMACREVEGYTTSDLSAYKDQLTDELFKRCHRWGNIVQRLAELPLMYAEQVLTTDKDERPCVKYQQLFRWREAVKTLGEDLFTTSFLAARDKTRRTDFFWPNVITHDNESINEVLDGGLSDIHAHFGGGVDSFQFNWICLMNDVISLPRKFDNAMTFSYNQVTAFDKPYSFKKMASWCRVAATIRVYLLKMLLQGEATGVDKLKETLNEIGQDADTEKLMSIQGVIDSLRDDARKTVYGLTLDYAITEELAEADDCATPNCVYAGERQIEYLFYKEYLKERPTMKGEWTEMFYLYELIKNHFRRECVFANELAGLDFYNAFQSRTGLFSKAMESISNIYSVQTGFRKDKDDHLESRITSNTMGLSTETYGKSLFSHDAYLEEDEMDERLSFVVQLTKRKSKKETDKSRYYGKRTEIHEEFNQIGLFVENKQNAYEITGIDVGGMELQYRPEVFAHAIRAGKAIGYGVTYHVGEEYYDLVDGMRAIWEIIQFTDSDPIDRLGHCLALGVHAKEYYENKHHTLSLPKQILLDNLVWLCCYSKENGIRISGKQSKTLKEKAKALYDEIGYGRYVKELTMEDYYQSLQLRSDEADPDEGLDVWSRTAMLDTPAASKARTNENAVRLNEAFNVDEDIISNGRKTESWKCVEGYGGIVGKVQKKMRRYVNEKIKCIEGCPSSNLQIGKLGRYDRHPAIRYYLNPDVKAFWPFLRQQKMNFAICTDAKGVFATSLVNELSLLALAAEKKYGWNKKIASSFEDLVTQGNKYRFKSVLNGKQS